MSGPVTISEELWHGIAVMKPTVGVGPGRSPLPVTASERLIRVVVDSHLRLPDMFELTFVDDGEVLREAGIQLGTELEIRGGIPGETSDRCLVVGEVTAIEGVLDTVAAFAVVRGYSHDHRLQRVRRTRTFLNATDSDIARQIAGQAGLRVGQVDATRQAHDHIAQQGQTDWSFLTERAREIGYEVGVLEGGFFFRQARSAQGGSGTQGAPLPVTLGEHLVRFLPRISAANLVPEVEVRTWDPVEAKAVAARVATATGTATVGAGTADQAARPFAGRTAPGAQGAGGRGEVGPPPSTTGYVVVDHPLPVPAGSDRAVTDTAGALAEHVGSGFAEAEGELLGDARVTAGSVLKIDNVPAQFAGDWLVTNARHVFDANDGGYRTRFVVSGRQDRSLLALTGGTAGQRQHRVDGVVCGVVTDVSDPLHLGRVKVTLPWLSPEHESAWAPVSQLFAAAAGGALFVPGPDEQVLVAFEHGDLRRPYVLGSLVNNRTGTGSRLDGSAGSARPGSTAVKAGQPAAVIRRGFVSPTGSRVVFHDEAPPSGGRPTAAQVIVATGQDKIALILDQVAGTLTLQCAPGSPPGTLKIECDGNVELRAGASGTLTVDGGQLLSLKAEAVQIEATAAVTVKGKPIRLN